MNFHKMFTVSAKDAFTFAQELANKAIRCKLYKENSVWVVEPN